MTRMCPHGGRQKDQWKVPIRLLTMTKEDGKDSQVVTGKLSIFGISMFVLFDSGATHYFHPMSI